MALPERRLSRSGSSPDPPPGAEAFQQVAAIDRLVHEPARLAVMTALSACESADFTYLQRLTNLTNGNLSTHLTRLAEAGLVRVEKRFVNKVPNTLVSLTSEGRRAIDDYWRRIDALRSGLRP
jgi:DNA-binding MarR family transcriptional regulator